MSNFFFDGNRDAATNKECVREVKIVGNRVVAEFVGGGEVDLATLNNRAEALEYLKGFIGFNPS